MLIEFDAVFDRESQLQDSSLPDQKLMSPAEVIEFLNLENTPVIIVCAKLKRDFPKMEFNTSNHPAISGYIIEIMDHLESLLVLVFRLRHLN